MREVAAMRQTHSENRVARLQHRRIGRLIGLRSGVRLDIRVLGPNSCFARSRARFSTTSTNSQPP